MIVPMKKVSLIVLSKEKENALKKLRKSGLLQIEITEGTGGRVLELKEQIALLENAAATLSSKADKSAAKKEISKADALLLAKKIADFSDETKNLYGSIAAYRSEIERLKNWGTVDVGDIAELENKGIKFDLYEMSAKEFKVFREKADVIVLSKTKPAVRLVVPNPESFGDALKPFSAFKVELPKISTKEIEAEILKAENRVKEIENEISENAVYLDGIKNAVSELQKETEFEIYSTGMENESLSDSKDIGVAYFGGYIPADELDKLSTLARENSWGLLSRDPTEEDDVPTKLKNNRFVSLIYPLTDFLGTVPGYFEYDISGWFLGFILIFFGIIFGDGGYGLLICAVAGALMLKAKLSKKPIPPTIILIMLLGCATVLWGTLTCTWFGLTAIKLPAWIKNLSIPYISNVYEKRRWFPFWTNGEAALTTAQNVQIFCFALALLQLTVAHIKGMKRNCKSLKMLSDLGSILQLIGMFYVVMSLVVNGQVFPLGLVISGVPVGKIAIILVAVGFVMSFVFANYEGSILKSVLDSLKNIVSVLLGVVNVFSDIVSYIRLWAVGLAGAAISATVNELAGPLLGKLSFIVFAVILLVFGHGLNMILNILSVIVHGVRLNTLEFSSHLDMSWSGHKFKPFEE